MLYFGTVCEQDHDAGKYRVELPAYGIATAWLSPLHAVTRNAHPFAPLAIGEHVAVLLDSEGVDGVILGAIYSTKDKPEGTGARTFFDFLDKVKVEFDADAGELLIENNTASVVVSATKITVKRGPDTLGAVLSDLCDALVAETHISSAPGAPTGPPINLASYIALKARINTFLG